MSNIGFARRSRARAVALALLAASLLPACAPDAVQAKVQAARPPAVRVGPLEPLAIVTHDGRIPFKVELADNEAERERGLMFRRAMPSDQGMLFDFKTPRPVYFWMKNTYLPLDMVFIARDGRIVAIAANTTPLSEAPVGPGVPVMAVLELNAGRAAALGILPGDRVEHRIFTRP